MTVTDDRPRHLYTAAEAARRLRINPGRIRVWAHRRLIHSYGLDERNRPMYDRDDLVAMRDGRRPKKPPNRGNAGAS